MKALPIINVIYENENYFVFSKPPHLHSIGKTETEPSAALMALSHNLECRNLGNDLFEHGLVNRLDFQSSGIMLVAKSQGSWERLRDLYSSKSVTKEYMIFCEGILEEDVQINNFIGSQYRRAKKLKVFDEKPSAKKRARPAKSVFSPIKSFSDLNASLILAEAKTGVRHQIRAHAAHMGFPLIGDELYGSTTSLAETLNNDEAPDFMLHASKISFKDPWTESPVEIGAELPEYASQLAK